MSNMLISHWHCIVPIVVIVLAMVFMRGKGSGSEKQSEDITKGDDKNVK